MLDHFQKNCKLEKKLKKPFFGFLAVASLFDGILERDLNNVIEQLKAHLLGIKNIFWLL